MTQTPLLERRMKTFEQRKNRLKQMEASLSVQRRKQRTRRLIEPGGLVVKANLDTWPSNTLLGAFLSLKENAHTQEVNDWTYQGRLRFAADTRKTTRVHVTFPSFPEGELLEDIKLLGLTWKETEHVWVGRGDVQELKVLLEPQGGLVREGEQQQQQQGQEAHLLTV